MISLLLLLLLLSIVALIRADEASGDAKPVEAEFIEEEMAEEGDDHEAEGGAEQLRPDPIDWTVEPEGPAVSYEILSKPENCVKAANDGDVIELHYTATLAASEQKFDSSYDQGKPLKMVLGDRKRSIRGFDVGLQGVCAGERRLVTIPPAWAYGAKGLGPIPPESTLKFEIEVLEVADAPTTPDAAAAPSPPQASWNDWLIFVLLIGSVAGLTLYYQKKYKTQKKMKANGKKGVGTPKAIVRLAQELKKKNAVSVAAADEKSQ